MTSPNDLSCTGEWTCNVPSGAREHCIFTGFTLLGLLMSLFLIIGNLLGDGTDSEIWLLVFV